MANDIEITVVGNLTADPELRYTQNGVAVANLTIAQTPRSFDKATNEWKDGEPVFLRSSIWRDYAEHVAGSLQKGQRVIAIGYLRQRSYETKEGEKRTAYELEINEIGPALRYGTAAFQKAATPEQNAQAAAHAPAQTAPAAPVTQQAPAAPAAPAQAAAPVQQVVPAAAEEVVF